MTSSRIVASKDFFSTTAFFALAEGLGLASPSAATAAGLGLASPSTATAAGLDLAASFPLAGSFVDFLVAAVGEAFEDSVEAGVVSTALGSISMNDRRVVS